MRHTMYAIHGGGETSVPTGELTLLPGFKPEIAYTPSPSRRPERIPNALWPLTPQTMHARLDDMTEEAERRAMGTADELASIEQIYEEGEK